VSFGHPFWRPFGIEAIIFFDFTISIGTKSTFLQKKLGLASKLLKYAYLQADGYGVQGLTEVGFDPTPFTCQGVGGTALASEAEQRV
jgi:hypothetical protein